MSTCCKDPELIAVNGNDKGVDYHNHLALDMLLSIKQFIVDRCPVPLWLRRAGLAGFLFFLIKGLLWLIVPTLLILFGQQS